MKADAVEAAAALAAFLSLSASFQLQLLVFTRNSLDGKLRR
jgi:hypothetical protein